MLKWRHAGQACIAANRVLVHTNVYDKFKLLLVEATQKLKIGHGAANGTTLGPLTTMAGVEKTHSQVQDAIAHGGQLLLGGNTPNGLNGYYYSPTIIAEANSKMAVATEETFGPLCALFRFEKEEQAIEMANKTSMGLASYFFTRDVSRTWRLVESLEAGMIGMNTGTVSILQKRFSLLIFDY